MRQVVVRVLFLPCIAGLDFLHPRSLCGQEAFAAMYLVELLRAIRIMQANPFKVSVVSFRKPLRRDKESFCSYYRLTARGSHCGGLAQGPEINAEQQIQQQ